MASYEDVLGSDDFRAYEFLQAHDDSTFMDEVDQDQVVQCHEQDESLEESDEGEHDLS